jgi:soluble lytic murein transglycosylase-like protein
MRWCLVALAWTAAAGIPEPLKEAMQKQRLAAVAQRKAVEQQLASIARFRTPQAVAPAAPPAPADISCAPVGEAAIEPILERAGQSNGVPVKLLRAVVQQESAFRPCAVSAKGAKGLMQLMPAAIEQFAVSDPFDPPQNVEAGARFLNELLTRFNGDVRLALAAYNAGPSNIKDEASFADIEETRNYVDSIWRVIGGAGLLTPRPPRSLPASRPDPHMGP